MLKKLIFFLFILLPVINCAAQQLNTKLTVKEAAALEEKLKQTPDDADARKNLIFYYTVKETPATKIALQRHRVALVQNNPEAATAAFLGIWFDEGKEKADYTAIKNVWLKQIAADKLNNKIRFNALEFFNIHIESDLVEKLLKDGQALDPDNLEFPERLVEFYNNQFDNLPIDADEPKTKILLNKIVAEAKNGLAKIDKEEYDTAIEKRAREMFLISNAKAFFELADFNNAGAAVGQLLDSLGKPEDLEDDDAVEKFQIAMSIAGRIELRKGNATKAREYLLSAVNRVQKERIYNPKVDVRFLEEFVVSDGKRSVLEYLQQLELFDLPEEIQTNIKKWQSMLSKGKFPDFDDTYMKLY